MELEVVVSKGRGLLAMDTSMFSKSSSDPYVVVVVEGKEIGRTEVVSKSLNPCWSERTSFRAFVAGTGPVSVELRLFDEDKLSRDARARVRDEGAERRALAPAWVERLRDDFCAADFFAFDDDDDCLLYTSPSPRDQRGSRMPSSA